MSLLEDITALELVKIRFRLEFQELFHFEPEMVLHWRKELLRGARRMQTSGSDDARLFALLLDPPPAVDPYAQKLFQKPSPPFSVDPVGLQVNTYDAGDVLSLDVSFPGPGVQNVVSFARILTGIGKAGFFMGEGRFEIEGIQALTHSEGWQPVWSQGADLGDLSAPLLNVRWLLEDSSLFGQGLLLKLVTPARLLRNNRPLYTPDFSTIFPYALRRVTSVLYACYQQELDVSGLIAEANAVATTENRLCWVDWRQLHAVHGVQGVGGVLGSITLNPPLSDKLTTLLKLAELFNIGKGACYGTGRMVLEPREL